MHCERRVQVFVWIIDGAIAEVDWIVIIVLILRTNQPDSDWEGYRLTSQRCVFESS